MVVDLGLIKEAIDFLHKYYKVRLIAAPTELDHSSAYGITIPSELVLGCNMLNKKWRFIAISSSQVLMEAENVDNKNN